MTKISPAAEIHGVFVVEPARFSDDRGFFVETYRRAWFPEGREMVQANRSDKQKNTLVGLHFHLHQADYWYVPHGTAQVVLHDLREGSSTDGATMTLDIGDQNHLGVFIPPGVAHGFAALTDLTITYLVDQYYNPKDELGVAWNDPAIVGVWKVKEPILSKRDQQNPLRTNIPAIIRPHASLRT